MLQFCTSWVLREQIIAFTNVIKASPWTAHTHSPVMYSNIAPVILHHLDVLHLIKQCSCYIHLNSMLLLTQALLMLYQTCGLYSIPCIIAKLLKTANRDVLMVQYEYIHLSDVLTWTLARRKSGIKKINTLINGLNSNSILFEYLAVFGRL